MMEDSVEATVERIDRFVQAVRHLGMDLVTKTELEQGCDPGSTFQFISPKVCTDHLASNYFEQKIKFCRSNIHVDSPIMKDFQLRERIKHFVASKADIVFKMKGKEKLRSGIDYNADGSAEAYKLFATQMPPLEFGMQISHCGRRAHVFQILKLGDIVVGKVVGKRPFGIFVRITSLVHGRKLDFSEIDIQALCHKSELENDHKSREHFDPIDDFEVDDIVRGVICFISLEEERIAISFRSSRLPSEYGNIELGVIEDADEQLICRSFSFDEVDYNEYLEKDPGFANPTNVQTLVDVLGIDTKPPTSFLRSCQKWSFSSEKKAASLRKQQSVKWSMDTTAKGVESFKLGEHDKAIKYFNHALQIYEDNAEALVARGALHANENKLENAITDFRQALKVHPKHHNAYKYLKETLFEKAVRLEKVGNVKLAIGIFQEVLEMDPCHTDSQDHLHQLQTVVLTNECVDGSSKERKADTESTKEDRHFDLVRKLIETDPELVRSKKKKKKRKKKKRKGAKLKKRTRKRSVSSESTCTASETAYSDEDEWIEKRLEDQPGPQGTTGRDECLKTGITNNVTGRSISNTQSGPLEHCVTPDKNFGVKVDSARDSVADESEGRDFRGWWAKNRESEGERGMEMNTKGRRSTSRGGNEGSSSSSRSEKNSRSRNIEALRRSRSRSIGESKGGSRTTSEERQRNRTIYDRGTKSIGERRGRTRSSRGTNDREGSASEQRERNKSVGATGGARRDRSIGGGRRRRGSANGKKRRSRDIRGTRRSGSTSGKSWRPRGRDKSRSPSSRSRSRSSTSRSPSSRTGGGNSSTSGRQVVSRSTSATRSRSRSTSERRGRFRNTVGRTSRSGKRVRSRSKSGSRGRNRSTSGSRGRNRSTSGTRSKRRHTRGRRSSTRGRRKRSRSKSERRSWSASARSRSRSRTSGRRGRSRSASGTRFKRRSAR